MTAEPTAGWLARLGREVDGAAAELARAATPEAREAVKRRIAGLHREAEAAATSLADLRQRIQNLVDRYKQGQGPVPAVAEPGVRRDHLGASTYIEKGWSLIAQGEHATAQEALRKALELSPGDVQAKSLLGWAEMLGGEDDRALATFSEVLSAEPANALARVNVGFICLRKRIFGEAIEHLSRVIRLDNDRKASLYAHYYLGLVYLERNMLLDAQTFLEKAIHLGPSLVEAYFDLGRAQWAAGDREAAKITWSRGAGANRFAPGAKRCQDALAAVERGEPVPGSSSPG